MNERNQLQIIIADMGDFIQEIFPHRIFRRFFLILGGIGIVAIFSGLVWWYFKTERDSAYADLTYLMIDLKAAKENIDTDWGIFQNQFLAEQVNRGKAKNTAYLPLLHVDLLIQQGKIQEARVLLEQYESSFSSSPLFSHVKVLHALLLIDGSKEDQIRGIELLQKIAQNEDDYAYEYAAYQLGFYHFINADFAQAKAIWQPMVDKALMSEKNKSVWVSRAEEKINQIP